MRSVVIDTETSGISVLNGHRIVELAAVEVVDGRLTGQEFLRRVDPGVRIDDAASRVHGIYDTDVLGLPRFAEIAEEFLLFVGNSQLVGHNIAFDLAFLDAEFPAVGPWRAVRELPPVCTLKAARAAHRARSYKLRSVAEKLGIPIPEGLHSALVDARLCAEVYIRLTSGKQSGFELPEAAMPAIPVPVSRPPLVVRAPGIDELRAHEQFCDLNKLRLF